MSQPATHLGQGRGCLGARGLAGSSAPAALSPVTPNPSRHGGWLAKTCSASSSSIRLPFISSFHAPRCLYRARRKAAGRFLFISDKLRSDHPFGFLQDGNFCKGGCMAAQLEHPLGYSCVSSSTLCSAANFASAQESSPMPCLVQPRGIQGCSQALWPWGQEDAPCRRFCPVSPADMGSQEKFTLPGLFLVWGSMACCG